MKMTMAMNETIMRIFYKVNLGKEIIDSRQLHDEFLIMFTHIHISDQRVLNISMQRYYREHPYP